MNSLNISTAEQSAGWSAHPTLGSSGVEGSFGERLASRGARLGAALLDGVLGLVALMPGALLSAMEDPYRDSVTGTAVMGLGLIGLAVLQSVMISTSGQSVGKKALGIKIVRKDDGAIPGFWRGVVLRQGVMGLISMIPVAGPIASLVDPLLIFGTDRRCMHDHIAGTEVVRA